jgi:putative membrane protein
VAVYCFVLPLGLIDTLHEYTPLAVAMVSYALFGLDAIGDEIEDPFGSDTNDLPLLQMSTNIEINLRQRMGEQELPAAVKPVRGVLL